MKVLPFIHIPLPLANFHFSGYFPQIPNDI
jgi:hypothetical protein